jgi:putative DNA primase/helicase
MMSHAIKKINLTDVAGIQSDTQKNDQNGFPCTDMGNGERFADQHRRDAHYCHPQNKWYVWSGKHWKPDNEGLISRLAKKTTRSIYNEATQENDSYKRSRLAKWAASSESSFRQKAMLQMAQSEPGIPIQPDELDRNDWLLNVNNGTLDLKNGKLLPHRRDNLITKVIPIDYNPDAFCNNFMEFLNLILDGKQDLIEYLCRVAGYTLTGDIGEQCLFLLHGIGQNGKSTFLNVLQSILGDYSIQTDFSTFNVKHTESIRNDIARMRTSRLVVAIETGDNKRLDEPVVKQLTGGDRVAARFLHQEYFEFRPKFKIFLAANYKPTIYGQDLAIWRRIRLIPFTVTIPESDRIANYESILLHDKEGILNWMVSGCLQWQEQGLNEPDEVKMATDSYRTEMDILNDFIADQCIIDQNFKSTHKELYSAYTAWCEKNGESAIKTKTFGKRLEGRGFDFTKPGNLKTWQGIKPI